VHGFDLIQGQHLALELLTTLLRKGHVPHALIFAGIDGIGKQTTARIFAMACNCLDLQPYPASKTTAEPGPRVNPCGRCRNCRRIRSDNHPDVIHVRPSGRLIRIAVIRDLIQRLAIKPHEAGRRVVVMAEAHYLNPEAGNALLKLLEEPPEKTHFILTARQTSDLLPTIASRGQQIRFRPLAPETLATLLAANEGLTPEDAAAASVLSGGSYTRALAMTGEGWIPKRRWLAGEISRLEDRPTAVLLALAEKLAAGKQQLPDALGWLLSWYRDLIVYPFRPDQILNRDLDRHLRAAVAHGDLQAGIRGMQAVQGALKALQENANPRLTMESLVLQLAAVQGPLA
jgi:DNA polymerase-3 subunit delta'